jgi:hypothetical protein
MLFPELTAPENDTIKFQIKSTIDPYFGMQFTLNENEDPDSKALEQLGYFVVPEFNVY